MITALKKLSPHLHMLFAAAAAVVCAIPSHADESPSVLQNLKILSAKKPPPPHHYKGTIVLDIGHGGKTSPNKNDSGATGYLQVACSKKKKHRCSPQEIEVMEVERNFASALMLKSELEKLNYLVVLTRTTEWTNEVDRIFGTDDATPMAIARTSILPGADAFIAIHQDDEVSKQSIVDHPNIYYSACGRNTDQTFAELVAEGSGGVAKRNWRGIGVLSPRYHSKQPLNKNLDRVAALFEESDLENQHDLRSITNPKFLLQLNKRLAAGIDFALSNPALLKMRAASSNIIGVCEKNQTEEAKVDDAPSTPTVAAAEPKPVDNTPAQPALLPLPDSIAPLRPDTSDKPDTASVSQMPLPSL